MRRRIMTLCGICLCLALLLGTVGCALSFETTQDFVGDTQELSVGSPVKHYFNTLDETEKQAYNAVLSEVYSFPGRVNVPILNEEQLTRVYTALLYDNPDLFFLDRRSTLSRTKKRAYFVPKYVITKEDYEAMKRKCDKVADGILEEARAAKTDFDREKIVHDRLIDLCTYADSDEYSYKTTIYGALCGGTASCEGYAKSAKYLLDQLGIACYVVAGNSTPPGSASRTHMWNVVRIDNAYYHLDLTWDDPVLDSGRALIRYTYFNVTDDAIAKTHSAYEADPCTSIEYNYFVHERLLFTEWNDDAKERTAQVALDSINAGSEGFQLRFGNREAYEDAKQDLFAGQAVYTLLQQLREQTDKSFATDHTSYLFDENDYMIDVILEY